jgi:hypothetical protein
MASHCILAEVHTSRGVCRGDTGYNKVVAALRPNDDAADSIISQNAQYTHR